MSLVKKIIIAISLGALLFGTYFSVNGAIGNPFALSLSQVTVRKLDTIIQKVENKKDNFSQEEKYKDFVLSISQKLLYLYKVLIETSDIEDIIEQNYSQEIVTVSDRTYLNRIANIIFDKKETFSDYTYNRLLSLITKKLGYLYIELDKIYKGNDNIDPGDLTLEELYGDNPDIELLKGKLYYFVHESGAYEHSGIFVFIDGGGKRYTLEPDEQLLTYLPLGERLLLPFTWEDGKLQLYKNEEGIVLFERLEEQIEEGDQKLIGIALYYYVYKDDARFGYTYTETQVENHATAVQNYYTEVSNGKWEVHAKPFIIKVGLTREECRFQDKITNKCSEIIKDQKNKIELDLEGKIYPVDVLLESRHREKVNSKPIPWGWGDKDPDPKVCGHGILGAPQSWIYCPVADPVIFHELGHNFGMIHANSHYENEPYIEYGDDTVTQGLGSGHRNNPFELIWAGLNAPELVFMKFNNPDTTAQVTETSKIFLAPVEWDISDVPDGVQQIVNIKGYYLSTKQAGNGELYVQQGGMTSVIYEKMKIGDRLEITKQLGGTSEYENALTGETREMEINETEDYENPIIIESIDYKPHNNLDGSENLKGGIVEVNVYLDGDNTTPDPYDFLQPPRSMCIDTAPRLSSICPMGLENVANPLRKMAVSECIIGDKCNFKCNEGYHVTDDKRNCEITKTVFDCRGNKPVGAYMCPLASYDLSGNQNIKVVETCGSGEAKCEYICENGYEYSSGNCIKINNKITISSSASSDIPPEQRPENPMNHFFISSDTIHWTVQNAGPNGKACTEYIKEDADEHSGHNIGYCDNKDNFADMSEDEEWEYKGGIWRSTQILNESDSVTPGNFKIVWYNPDTKRTGQQYRTLEN